MTIFSFFGDLFNALLIFWVNGIAQEANHTRWP